MTVKTLQNILSGMPEDAEVVMCIGNDLTVPMDEYQPVIITAVCYDQTDETVELREDWS